MVPSIIDVLGYDREFCSSSSSPSSSYILCFDRIESDAFSTGK